MENLVLPFASMYMGLHQSIRSMPILNIIAFDMSIEEAMNAPSGLYPALDMSNPESPKTTVRGVCSGFSRKCD